MKNIFPFFMAASLLLISVAAFSKNKPEPKTNWTFKYDSCFVYYLFNSYGDPYLSAKFSPVKKTEKGLNQDINNTFVLTTNVSSLFSILKDGLDFPSSTGSYSDSLIALHSFMDSIYRNDLSIQIPYDKIHLNYQKIHHISKYSIHEQPQGLVLYDESDRAFEGEIAYAWINLIQIENAKSGKYPRFFHWYFTNHKIVIINGEAGTLRLVRYKHLCD